MQVELSVLKKELESGKINSYQKVFIYTDNTFLVDQYIDEIELIKEVEKVYIQDVSELYMTSDIFNIHDKYLYVYKNADLKNISFEKIQLDNVIIVSKGIDKEVEEELKRNTRIQLVKFPEAQAWQTVAYMHLLAPGLDIEHLKWLHELAGGDIYLIKNELEKIGFFNVKEQKSLLTDIFNSGGYDILTNTSIYNLVNAIVKRDLSAIGDTWKSLTLQDMEPATLINNLLYSLKNIMGIQMTKSPTAKMLGLKENQFKALMYYKDKYSDEQLINIYDFLTSIDYEMRLGNLSMDKSRLLDFILCNVVS